MTRFLAAALALAALGLWSPAQAASWAWSYQQTDTIAISGVFEGTLLDDGNTLDVTGFSMAAYNGVAYETEGYSLITGPTVATLDGSSVNFLFIDQRADSVLSIVSDAGDVYSRPTSEGDLFRTDYDRSAWSIEEVVETTPVPLPASGLLLLAGLGGFAMLRRRKTAV
ncbi:MAG: VPLPA-CTERM sorting domain-containing protein [Pseudomonadota bacterium]